MVVAGVVRWLLLGLLMRRAAQRVQAAEESRSPREAVVVVVAVVPQQLSLLKWRRYSKGINSHCGCGSFRYRPTEKNAREIVSPRAHYHSVKWCRCAVRTA